MILLQQDKVKHIASSALIVLVLAPFTGIAVGIAISVVLGGIKEIVWDKWMGKGCPDMEDMLADITGALGGGLVCYLISLLF